MEKYRIIKNLTSLGNTNYTIQVHKRYLFGLISFWMQHKKREYSIQRYGRIQDADYYRNEYQGNYYRKHEKVLDSFVVTNDE